MDYRLYCGDKLLGTLTRTGHDFPWHIGTFNPTSAFDEFRPLFEREAALLEEDRMEEWGEAWDGMLALGVRLEHVASQRIIDELILHVDGNEATWRY